MTPKPSRSRQSRWRPQFSLRTFFIVLSVACVWFGWQVERAREQRDVVDWIKHNGGSVVYDYQRDEAHEFIDDVKPPFPRWLVALLGIDFFCDVIHVSLYDTQVNDLTPLKNLKDVEVLRIRNTQVSDLTPLAGLSCLTYLDFSHTEVRDLTPLAKLLRLKRLDLGFTPASDLTPLADLSSLETLYFHRTRVRDLTPLGELKSLKTL